jgi:hypothetical protein
MNASSLRSLVIPVPLVIPIPLVIPTIPLVIPAKAGTQEPPHNFLVPAPAFRGDDESYATQPTQP